MILNHFKIKAEEKHKHQKDTLNSKKIHVFYILHETTLVLHCTDGPHLQVSGVECRNHTRENKCNNL